MSRRKKIPKLPNGYGQIRFLGKGRRNPYGVYPPAVEEYDNGKKKTPAALCYVSDRMVGLAVLTSYHAGTYTPGSEVLIEQQMRSSSSDAAHVFSDLIADYNKHALSINVEEKPTFSDVFRRYYLDKFDVEYGHTGKKKSMEYSMISAYKNCAVLHNCAYSDLKADDLQEVLTDTADRLSYSSAELVKTLLNQMDRYAMANDIIEKGYAGFIRIKSEDDDEHGVPFSDEELGILWKNREDEVVEMLLIMCYSGFRISAYHSLEVNLKSRYFKGGVKTDAGKDRIVPIHSAIIPFVRRRIKCYGHLMTVSNGTFRDAMYDVLERIGIPKHTPHDCRHTFSRLCEKYHVNDNDRKRMLGHSFGNDITNRIYGHRTLEDLRGEIEKIQADLL